MLVLWAWQELYVKRYLCANQYCVWYTRLMEPTNEQNNTNMDTNKVVEKTATASKKVQLTSLPKLNVALPSLSAFRKKSFVIPTAIMVVIAGITLVMLQNKGWFFAGRVNNTMILRSEFNKVMTQRYGTSTFEELITFALVRDELKKNNINVSDDELNTRISEIEAGLGGMKLEDVLKSQGQSLDEFNTQMKLELGAERLLKDKVSVTEQEIKDYITKNAKDLLAKDPEGQRTEAQNALFNQKIQQEVANWVKSLRTDAKVDKYF